MTLSRVVLLVNSCSISLRNRVFSVADRDDGLDDPVHRVEVLLCYGGVFQASTDQPVRLLREVSWKRVEHASKQMADQKNDADVHEQFFGLVFDLDFLVVNLLVSLIAEDVFDYLEKSEQPDDAHDSKDLHVLEQVCRVLADQVLESEERNRRNQVDPEPALEVVARDLLSLDHQPFVLCDVDSVEVEKNVQDKDKKRDILNHFKKSHSFLHERNLERQEKNDHNQHDRDQKVPNHRDHIRREKQPLVFFLEVGLIRVSKSERIIFSI